MKLNLKKPDKIEISYLAKLNKTITTHGEISQISLVSDDIFGKPLSQTSHSNLTQGKQVYNA
jgi:hypothetical protein